MFDVLELRFRWKRGRVRKINFKPQKRKTKLKQQLQQIKEMCKQGKKKKSKGEFVNRRTARKKNKEMSAKDSPRTLGRKSMALPTVVKENISVKTLKILGDKKLMPRAARKRLGSSLSGKQLHEYIEAMKKEDSEHETLVVEEGDQE